MRVNCDGELLCVDSSLGRWYHLYGNCYCTGDGTSRSGGGGGNRDAEGSGEKESIVASLTDAELDECSTGRCPCSVRGKTSIAYTTVAAS